MLDLDGPSETSRCWGRSQSLDWGTVSAEGLCLRCCRSQSSWLSSKCAVVIIFHINKRFYHITHLDKINEITRSFSIFSNCNGAFYAHLDTNLLKSVHVKKHTSFHKPAVGWLPHPQWGGRGPLITDAYLFLMMCEQTHRKEPRKHILVHSKQKKKKRCEAACCKNQVSSPLLTCRGNSSSLPCQQLGADVHVPLPLEECCCPAKSWKRKKKNK